MQNRILLIVVFCLSLILVNISSGNNTTFFKEEEKINVKNTDTNNIEEIELEDYIIGVKNKI